MLAPRPIPTRPGAVFLASARPCCACPLRTSPVRFVSVACALRKCRLCDTSNPAWFSVQPGAGAGITRTTRAFPAPPRRFPRRVTLARRVTSHCAISSRPLHDPSRPHKSPSRFHARPLTAPPTARHVPPHDPVTSNARPFAFPARPVTSPRKPRRFKVTTPSRPSLHHAAASPRPPAAPSSPRRPGGPASRRRRR